MTVIAEVEARERIGADAAPPLLARLKQRWYIWALLAPSLLILIGTTVYPFLYLLYESFFSTNLMNPDQSKFIGLQNFINVFTDYGVLIAFRNTFVYVFASVGLEFVIGLILALILNRDMAGTQIFTTLTIIPMAITPVVGALIWRHLLTPPVGWIDYYLMKFGLMHTPYEWLGHAGSAMMSAILVDVWQWTPFVALILLAGLRAQPVDPYEAAMIDGASRLQIFRFITLPFLKHFITIAVVLRLIDAFKTFGSVYVLTGGGPGNSTELVNLTVYRVALQSFRVGYGAAIGFIFLIILVFICGRFLKVLQQEAQ
jgi:multiple sugar transport system permease protein